MDDLLRDASISALKGLKKQFNPTTDEEKKELTPARIKGFNQALDALLKRTLPEMPELQAIAVEEPVFAIDQALAYLEYMPVDMPEKRIQETFDGFFVSLIIKSWWVRAALGILIAIFFGGNLFLGWQTKGAFSNINENTEKAVNQISRQRTEAISNIDERKTGVIEALNKIETEAKSAAAKTIGRIDELTKTTERNLELEIRKVSSDVVDSVIKKVLAGAEQKADGVIKTLEGLSTSSTTRINNEADRVVRNLGGVEKIANKRIELSTDAEIKKLTTDISEYNKRLDDMKEKKTALETTLESTRKEIAVLNEAVKDLKADDSPFSRISASFALKPWVMTLILLPVGIAVIASWLSFMGIRGLKQRLIGIALILILFIGLPYVGWQIGTRWDYVAATTQDVKK